MTIAKITTQGKRARTWYWPADDTKLRQVIDQVGDAELMLKHLELHRRKVCVQAGGACGVWPAYLAGQFDKVYTFEPHPENYKCLVLNTQDRANVIPMQAALDAFPFPFAMLNLHESEAGNAGAWYVNNNAETVPAQNAIQVPVTTIDALELAECDLIQLDVEGYESNALAGAEETVRKHRPLIVIEEKRLPQNKPGTEITARMLLEYIGYKEVARYHRDVVFRYCGKGL